MPGPAAYRLVIVLETGTYCYLSGDFHTVTRWVREYIAPGMKGERTGYFVADTAGVKLSGIVGYYVQQQPDYLERIASTQETMVKQMGDGDDWKGDR